MTKLVPFYLFSDVLVDGDLILTVKGDMAARVWSGPTTNSTLLLTSDQTITNGLPHTFATKGDTTEVWVEFIGAGPQSPSHETDGRRRDAEHEAPAQAIHLQRPPPRTPLVKRGRPQLKKYLAVCRQICHNSPHHVV